MSPSTSEPQVETPPFAGGPFDGSPDAEALLRLHTGIAAGDHWFTAVLEAISLWRSPQEEFGGRHYTYLLAGEAFDWLLLAERLVEELGDVVPEAERDALIFEGRFPVDLGPWEFQRLLGRAKYRAHLNFWYGVQVEEALLVAVEERLGKDHASGGMMSRVRHEAAAYDWVYGVSHDELLRLHFEDRGIAPTGHMSLTELWEFTYWCFKYRVSKRDPAKVASDTRIGVAKLQQLYLLSGRRPPVA